MLRREERRKTLRLLFKFPVMCEIIDEQYKGPRNKTFLGRDLSNEGIYFESDESLPLNTKIKASFQLPKSETVVNTNLEVARTEVIMGERPFGIGAIFTVITDKDKQNINLLVERTDIDKLFETAIKKGASDMHLTVGSPPVLRINGELIMIDMPNLDHEDITTMIYSLMNKQQLRIFELNKELDFGIQFDMYNRFRVNVHQQRGSVEATFRLINIKISSLAELRIPEIVKDLAFLKEGLILIIGTTGSGKSTTISAMVELINKEKKSVIITLERPIEYLHTNIKSIIKQREVGIDTNSFSAALKSSLKQDPDVIVVGELDDVETVKTALVAAEAGHLVIASLHAPNTVQAIDRLVNMFAADNRKPTLFQLSQCLKGICSQLLIPRKDKKGRVLAAEVLFVSEAVKKVIRNDELIQIPNIIQTGSMHKMILMLDSIKKYVEEEIIDPEEAKFHSEEYAKYLHY